jgi:hypothetical protein
MEVTYFKNRKPPTTGLRIVVNGDTTILSGPRRLMERILALPLLNYITMDGQIHTTIHDPLENPGPRAANGAMREARG